MEELARSWPDSDRRDDALLRLLEDVYRYEPPSPLSPQQRRVIECASRGLDAPETAEVLGVTLQSVKTHRRDARRKLKAKNTTHAACEALRQGLIR